MLLWLHRIFGASSVIRVMLSALFGLQLRLSSLFTCRPESWDRAPLQLVTPVGWDVGVGVHRKPLHTGTVGTCQCGRLALMAKACTKAPHLLASAHARLHALDPLPIRRAVAAAGVPSSLGSTAALLVRLHARDPGLWAGRIPAWLRVARSVSPACRWTSAPPARGLPSRQRPRGSRVRHRRHRLAERRTG